MRKKIRLALLVTVLSTLFVLQSSYAYENAEYGFSMDEPAGWNPLPPDEEGIVVGFVDPNVAVTGAFINVAVHDTGLSLSAYVEGFKQSEVDKYGTIVLESEGSRTVGGLEGYELVSSHTHAGMGQFTNKQVIFVENGKGFVVNAGAFSSEYDNSLGTFEQTIESFRITIDSSDDSGTDLTVVIVAVFAVVVIGAIVVIFFLRNKQKSEI